MRERKVAPLDRAVVCVLAFAFRFRCAVARLDNVRENNRAFDMLQLNVAEEGTVGRVGFQKVVQNRFRNKHAAVVYAVRVRRRGGIGAARGCQRDTERTFFARIKVDGGVKQLPAYLFTESDFCGTQFGSQRQPFRAFRPPC